MRWSRSDTGNKSKIGNLGVSFYQKQEWQAQVRVL